MKKVCSVFLCVLLTLPIAALPISDNSIEGTWEGVASAPPEPDIPFSVTFETDGDTLKGTMDIPSEGMTALPLQDLKFDGKKLSFVLPVPEASVTCNAQLEEDGSIAGTFEQMGQTGTFTMKKQQ